MGRIAKPFFPWVGGKLFLLPYIFQLLPRRAPRLLEVCGGSGAVTLGLGAGYAPLRVYNDIDTDLANLFRCARDRPLALLRDRFFTHNIFSCFHGCDRDLCMGAVRCGYIYNIQVLFDKLLIVFKYFCIFCTIFFFCFLCTLSDDVTESYDLIETTFLHSRKVFSVGDSSASYDSCF